LGTSIHNGDTWQSVARHFRTTVKVDPSKNANVQKVWRSRGETINPEDEIWHFQYFGGHGVYLQFRDGRNVNWDESVYSDPDRIEQLNHRPTPPLVLRRGIWPVCVVVFAIGVSLLVIADTRARPKTVVHDS
jgi:hypothetical protein